MALEIGDFVGDLVPSNPGPNDPKSQGDDHLRLIKEVLQNSFSGFLKSILVTGSAAMGGTANQVVLTVPGNFEVDSSPALITFTAPATNQGPMEINVNGLGYEDIIALSGGALQAGAVISGRPVVLLWDGAAYRLLAGGLVDTVQSMAPTPSFPDNTDAIATTAYVTQATLSASLPGQAGNAGKFLHTDGSNAAFEHVPNWVFVPVNSSRLIDSGDFRALLDVTSAATYELEEISSLFPEFYVYVRNNGVSAGIQIDTTGSDTINGIGSLFIPDGAMALIVIGGGEFKSFFFSGVGPRQAYTNTQAYTTPGVTTFNVPITTTYRITVIGPGGTGAFAAGAVSTTRYLASGGGGGGMAVQEVLLQQGDTYTVTVGAGGAMISAPLNSVNGNPGQGPSSVVGPGVNLIANPGQGGLSGSSINGGPSTTVAGGAGGSATGGDLNVPGRPGGNAAINAGGSGPAPKAGGGGAPDIFNVANSGGGNATGSNAAAAGGGAGSITGGQNHTSSAGSGGVPWQTTGPRWTDQTALPEWRLGYPVTGTGGDNRGGGTNGSISTAASITGDAQPFGGSGGRARESGATNFTGSGNAGIGAGSGGVVRYGSSVVQVGAGGDGLVIFEW